jgi:hypothetical protein
MGNRIASLRERTEDARRRLEASEQWLSQSGAGTYGPRTKGGSLADRRTRPIREEYFRRIVEVGSCLGCPGGKLVFKRRPSGGSYYACSSADGHLCYYLGFDIDEGTGYEKVVDGKQSSVSEVQGAEISSLHRLRRAI